jgi:hypothetical protein
VHDEAERRDVEHVQVRFQHEVDRAACQSARAGFTRRAMAG